MGLWAEADIICQQPRVANVKDIVLKSLKNNYGELDETIVKSFYSKDDGVIVYFRTTHVGEVFNEILSKIIKDLKKENIGFFYVEVKSNHFIF